MKELWRLEQTADIPMVELQKMTLEKSQPVLKKIKLQLMLEMVLWVMVIVVYHSAFDGDKRPSGINLIFVVGFVQAIAYNFSAYLAARNVIAGADLGASLFNYLKKLKVFKWTAICSRAVLMLAVIVFFSYGLELVPRRLIAIAGILTLFGIQLLLISLSWNKKIRKLSKVMADFKG